MIRPLGAATALAVLLAGCATAPPQAVTQSPQPLPAAQPQATPQPLPPAAPAPANKTTFVPATFADLPGWARDDVRAAWPAFMSSCSVLGKRADWKESCSIARTVNAGAERAIRLFFETFLQPQRVIAPDGSDTGLVTGYYEPLLRGTRKQGGVYQTPLYKVPDDMLTIDLASVYPELKGKRLRGRLQGRKVVPYASRAEIARADFKGKELLWVDDPVEAFFLEVQGSGRVQLDTGETVRVAYADQNGQPYQSIGKWLIAQGELTADQASAQGIKAWIAGHPTRRQELFNVNPSYVFFREEKLPDPNVGPKGSLGVPLTPQRSVAVDTSQIPAGAPLFLSTTQAASDIPLQRLVMAQDTGGAIKGAIRVDFFFGFGTEAAENAGRMKQPGQVWVLLPRPTR
ncbi:membrane-bound lytic murein transglycosylase A [Pseudoduganella lurida]|uniref:peptidoglycan lytic exotransglycosylase n=1 Tax=Pseudoduganella lurida TaxID=1036180 RepID=A0A562QVR4_9BURK|nr:murein transglycosylase A [Pseudoduganella lurida]TWI60872.1 membrane-bound lytic murein transglycosylase A [Pseudoduganella lurida]